MPNFCINFLNKAEKSLPILYDFAVAPLTGAWIKTNTQVKNCKMDLPSHPSRVRGLKQEIFIATYERTYVAPLTGAWIKTLGTVHRRKIGIESHPSRVRGLKWVI